MLPVLHVHVCGYMYVKESMHSARGEKMCNPAQLFLGSGSVVYRNACLKKLSVKSKRSGIVATT